MDSRTEYFRAILDPLVEGILIFNDILADKKVKPKDQIAELFIKKIYLIGFKLF